MKAAESHEEQLKQHKLLNIGEKYVEYLISIGKMGDAAKLTQKILKRDQPKLWEKWIYRFAEIGQLRVFFFSKYFQTHTYTI